MLTDKVLLQSKLENKNEVLNDDLQAARELVLLVKKQAETSSEKQRQAEERAKRAEGKKTFPSGTL